MLLQFHFHSFNYVRADKVLRLRELLDKLGTIPGMMGEEKGEQTHLLYNINHSTTVPPSSAVNFILPSTTDPPISAVTSVPRPTNDSCEFAEFLVNRRSVTVITWHQLFWLSLCYELSSSKMVNLLYFVRGNHDKTKFGIKNGALRDRHNVSQLYR